LLSELSPEVLDKAALSKVQCPIHEEIAGAAIEPICVDRKYKPPCSEFRQVSVAAN
jgi:hypothetical protein